jgi:outer membrane biosynthesis protein TonB
MRVRVQIGSRTAAAAPPGLGQPFAFSLALHSLLLALIVFPLAFGRSSTWGEIGAGGSGYMAVNLTAGIPLPPAPVANPVATDTTTMNPPEPKAEPAKEATPPALSGKEYQMEMRRQKKRWQDIENERLAKELQKFSETPSNAIPGRGGRGSAPMYNPMTTSQGQGGVGFSGDFGNLYGWYVRAVRECISRHWDRTRIDPSIRSAPKVFLAFDIVRDGAIVGEKVATSSGIPSVDREALRAVQACSGRRDVGAEAHLPPLPVDYSGRKVEVEVWFEFRH